MTEPPSSIDDLEPAPFNDDIRRISNAAVAGLRKSIERFGDLSRITFNTRTGHLVGGHRRVEQLREIGATLDGDSIVAPSGDRFPVRFVDWDEATEQAANLTANNRHISGEFTHGVNDLLDQVQASLGDDAFTDLELASLRLPDVDLGAPTNPDEEWDGMPEFDQGDATPYRTIKMHFRNEEDPRAFAALIGQKISEKTKFLWYPEEPWDHVAHLEYTSEQT